MPPKETSLTERERVTSFSLPKIFRRFLTTESTENKEKRVDQKNSLCSQRSLWLSILKSLNSALQGLSSGFKFGMGMIAAFITAGILAVAVTGVMNSFSDGETLTAGKLNTNFNSLKATIESLPNWTKNGSDAVFSGGNVIVNTTSAAKSACSTACGNSNAHMCTAHEMVITLQLAVSLPGSGSYWMTSPTTSANTDSLDCNSWTSASSAPNQGSIIVIGSPSQLFIAYCNTSHQIDCCL